MSVAKFVAANGREALRQVREAMGPDAVVLSNRTVDGGVEIVAMRDTDLGVISGSAQVFVPPAPPVPEIIQPAAQEVIGDLRGELQSMRALIERQMSGIGAHSVPAAGGDPLRDSLFEWLVGAGFSGQLARTLLSRLPVGHDRPAAMSWIRQEIASKVPVLTDEDALFGQGGVLALVGPTGVGKTTTTAKLAARFVLKHGAEKLALLTTDSFRIGAHEQLRIYGDILGVPVHAVKDASDLRIALSALAQKHLVIIDTVGMSQRDRNLSEQIAMLAGAPAPVQRVLLLNGASHGDTLNEVVHAYRNDATPGGGVDGCIISKLDEATHLGSVLDVVIRHRLPVFYASTGQRVPEHLELARGDLLVERAFAMPRRGSVFAEAQAARSAFAGGPAPESDDTADGAAHDVLRSITDSSHAVGACVSELQDGQYGFDLLRQLWPQRDEPDTALRAMTQTVRDAISRDVSQHCDRYVLACATTTSVPVPGRRAPQAWVNTVWLADRDGMPLAATVTPAGRGAHGANAALDTEAADLRAALAARRCVVNVLEAMPAPSALTRWQTAGERWLATARKTTRVVCDGAAWKLDALADTLTFHAIGETQVRGRDALQWVAQASVRVVEAQHRPAKGASADGGIDAALVVSRAIDRENGQTLAVDYTLCDPALAAEGSQVARWARWTEATEARCRTLRLATTHLRQPGADGAAAATCAGLVALQAGVTALRMEHRPAATAAPFLARLTGKTSKGAVAAATLVEGLGRLLALLDVFENYPARGHRPAFRHAAPAPSTDDGETLAASVMPAQRRAVPESAKHLAQQMAALGD
jgi:flagellar biosynthesis protein FlhF